MLNFGAITKEDFLKNHWQKKSYLFKQGFPKFQTPIEPDELAGLAMEEEFESRLVVGHVSDKQNWQLKTGPFLEQDFAQLPEKNWTLLVNGVDRFIPEVSVLLDQLNFLPQWRVDDVMVSYAATGGSVGPHFDVYDVFLLQGKGRREWKLTTQDCHEGNYEKDVPLRLMKAFEVEETFILKEGDVLYVPPYVGHHGVSLDNECMTYSFGYRGYGVRELWDSFGEYIADQRVTSYYRDPDWSNLKGPGEITSKSIEQARLLLKQTIDDPELFQKWFGQFATSLDQQSEEHLCEQEENDEVSFQEFEQLLASGESIERNALCRFAYIGEDDSIQFFVNGQEKAVVGVGSGLVQYLCSCRLLKAEPLLDLNLSKTDKLFIYDLCQRNLFHFS